MTSGLETETAEHVPSGPARLAERLLSRLLRLPPAWNDYRVERDVALATRDSIVLLADHYVPLTAAQRGTVLIRTPYGRGFPGDILDARVCAARGYHVLMQSCRGTYGSGGRFDPMVHEAEDSQDTVAWLRRQPWFDGRLATLGGSYLGGCSGCCCSTLRPSSGRRWCSSARTTCSAPCRAPGPSRSTTPCPGPSS